MPAAVGATRKNRLAIVRRGGVRRAEIMKHGRVEGGSKGAHVVV